MDSTVPPLIPPTGNAKLDLLFNVLIVSLSMGGVIAGYIKHDDQRTKLRRARARRLRVVPMTREHQQDIDDLDARR